MICSARKVTSEPVLADHHFGVIVEQDLEVLKLGEALLPKLLGHGGRLRYELQDKNKDKINKKMYKDYLKMITANLNNVLVTKNEDMKNATNQTPLTTQGVVIKLQGGMANKLLISHDEHSRILTQQVAFYASTVDQVLDTTAPYPIWHRPQSLLRTDCPCSP